MASSAQASSGDRLSPLDAAFLYLERPTELLHVGAVVVLEGPVSYERFVDVLAGRLAGLRRYRQRPVRPFLDWALPRWVDDPAFDPRRHVRHVRVRAPGGDAELHATVDRLFAAPLDDATPLWEAHLIDGLAGDRSAILTKVHHCMIDGVSGAKVLEVMTESTPDGDGASDASAATETRDLPPAGAPGLGARAGGMLAALTDAAAGIRGALEATVHPVRTLSQARAAVDAAGTVIAVVGERLGRLPFNGTLTGARRIVWKSFALDDFLAMRGAAGCKVNDVVLTVIAGALRSYLLARGADPAAIALRTLVPVNVRRSEDPLALGNRVSAMLARLPVDVADPIERLRRMTAEMRALKDAGQSRAFEFALAMAGALPAPTGAMLARLSALRPPVHTVCTNVPGPRETRYILGRRVLEMHPIVPIALGMGVGFAILSYDKRLSISATADPALVPEAERLPEMLAAAADELRTRLDAGRAAAPATVSAQPTRRATPTVGDLMTPEPMTIAPHDSLSAAWGAMRERRIRHLPVVERDGRLIGLVTHHDLLAAAQSSITFDREEDRVRLLGATAVFEIMETHLSTARAAEAAADAGTRMVRHKIGCLPVVEDDGRVIGIVTEEDFLRWATEHMAAA